MADVTLPQLGETVTEGTITQWFKQVGDTVAADEPLFEVSTDKVDTEVPSPVAGTLTEIRVQEGETVDVGTVIAVVGDGDGAPAAAEPPAADRSARRRGCARTGRRARGRRRHRVAGGGSPEPEPASAPAADDQPADQPATEQAPTEPAADIGACRAVGGQGHPAVAGRTPTRQRARSRPGGHHRHRARRAHHRDDVLDHIDAPHGSRRRQTAGGTHGREPKPRRPQPLPAAKAAPATPTAPAPAPRRPLGRGARSRRVSATRPSS